MLAGHPWLYASEFAELPGGLNPGDQVTFSAADGRLLGVGYVNPNNVLAGRMMAPGRSVAIDAGFVGERVAAALRLRERLYPGGHYRLIYGDSDGLPGMIVDRFGDQAVVQTSTAGADRLKFVLGDALREVAGVGALVFRDSGSHRKAEKLPEAVIADPGFRDPLFVIEGPVHARCSALTGQKTGWFYDQRDNRAVLAPLCVGARVLDVFSYTGGWALSALAAGASELCLIDSSAPALEHARAAIAAAGGVADYLEQDAFSALKALADAQRRFDVVVVDPPAFIKRRKDLPNGRRAYQRVVGGALRVLDRGGMLAFLSCSHHYPLHELIEAMHREALVLGRSARILALLSQARDHPILPAVAETHYLKGVLAQVD